MSRIGRKPIEIPKNVKIDFNGGYLSVDGPKGKLEHKVPENLTVTQKENKLVIEKLKDLKETEALWGLTKSLIVNLIYGVVEGYKKELEIRGVGYKAQVQGSILQLTLGFSHSVKYEIPQGITITCPKPTQVVITGIDKVKVGEAAAKIRQYFLPEPYKGKGIRYIGEYVRHKAGKTVVK